jgi:hypothetical protein
VRLAVVVGLSCALLAGEASAEAWSAISGGGESVTGMDFTDRSGPRTARTAPFVHVFRTPLASGAVFVVTHNEFDCDAAKVTTTYEAQFDLDGIFIGGGLEQRKPTQAVAPGAKAASMLRAACEDIRPPTQVFMRVSEFVSHWRETLQKSAK